MGEITGNISRKVIVSNGEAIIDNGGKWINEEIEGKQ